MEAYKFETTVLKNGVIQLPEISKFENHDVEIFIVIKQPDKQPYPIEKGIVEQFLDKWTGFLKGGNPDKSKLQYLSEKYK